MNKNGRTMVLAALMILVFFNLPAWAEDGEEPGLGPLVERMAAAKPVKHGLQIGLRLWGGMSFFDGGDINDTRSNVTLYETISGLEAVPYTVDQSDLNRSFEGGADLLLHLGKRFGVLLGASYLNGKSKNRIVIEPSDPLSSSLTLTFDPAVSAVPLTLGLFFTLPLGRRFGLMAEAGAGWTFARLAIDQKFIGSSGSMQYNAEGNAGGPCIYARLGLEASIVRKVFFFVEVLGRYVKISGFEGSYEIFHNDTIVDSGDVRFYTFDRDVSGHTIPFIDFAPEPPSGESVSHVRETEIDFSGVSARCGLRIRF